MVLRRCPLLPVVLLLGCAPAPGEGRLRLQVSGAPAVETSTTSMDGYAVHFTRLVVVLGDVVSRGSEGSGEMRDGRTVALDLVPPGPHVLSDQPVTAAFYNTVDVTLLPAGATTVPLNVTAELVAAMAAAGAAVHVEGTLFRDPVEKQFSWDVPLRSRFAGCGLNLQVTANATSSARLLFHGERALAENLTAAAPRLRAQPFVDADTNNDGTIDWAELAAFSGDTLDAVTPPLVPRSSPVDGLDQYVVAALSDALSSTVDQACASVTRAAPSFPDGGIP